MSFSDKSEPREVTAALATELRTYAGRRWPTANHKWRKARLASLLGMNERRVKSLYEADPLARIRHDEAVRIDALIGAEPEETSGREDRLLAQRVAELEAQLATVVAALARDEMAAGGMAPRNPEQRTDGGDGSSPRRRSTD